MMTNETHETPTQHSTILTAIKNRDPESAEFYMKQHIRSTYHMLFGIPDEGLK